MNTPEQVEHVLSDPSIGVLRLETLDLHFALSERHPAIRDGAVDLADLRNETFVFRDSCHTGR